MLDDIIDDIVCDMSAVQSLGYIYSEVPTETEEEIIRSAAATASASALCVQCIFRNVIKRYMDRLDQNFLASLEPFQQKAKRMQQPEVARIIGRVSSPLTHTICANGSDRVTRFEQK